MRALGFNGPWDLTIADRPDPVFGESEVLIEIIATGICGSDVHGYSGETGRRTAGQIMGHETVGRVRDSGSAVTQLPAGTLVTVNPIRSCGHCEACLDGENQVCSELKVIGVAPHLDGTFAELIVVPEHNVVTVNPNIPVLHGALIEPLAVGYHAVVQGDLRSTDRLLVIGGGPIGQAVLLGARRAGVTSILVSEPSPERRELLEKLGFATTSPQNLGLAITDVLGDKATAVIDAVGIDSSMSDALTHSTGRARIVLVGMGANRMSLDPYAISVAERRISGSYCYSDAHFRSTAEWVGEGHPELDLLIEKTLPLEDGPTAFRTIADGSVPSNKVMLLSASA